MELDTPTNGTRVPMKHKMLKQVRLPKPATIWMPQVLRFAFATGRSRELAGFYGLPAERRLRRRDACEAMKITKRTQNQNLEHLVNQVDPKIGVVFVEKTNPNLTSLGRAPFRILVFTKRGACRRCSTVTPLPAGGQGAKCEMCLATSGPVCLLDAGGGTNFEVEVVSTDALFILLAGY